MAHFQPKQLRHIVSGQVFNATPSLEDSPDYEVYTEAYIQHDEPLEVVSPKRRGRPPKATADAVEEVVDDGDA